MKGKERFFAVILFLMIQVTLAAEDKPSVAAFSLEASDTPEIVARTVNDLVFSFVRELRDYHILDMRTEPLPANMNVPDGTDYIFYGYLVNQSDGIKLELVLRGGPFAITRKISRIYDNTNRILLESRMLVRVLFDQTVALPDPAENTASPITGSTVESVAPETASDAPLQPVSSVDSLAGSWRGEEGVEKVMILRGGRGILVLSSGASLSLDLQISGSDLLVRQKGAATPRQFIDLPDPVARQAADIAPPLEWRFMITADQKTLSGTKKTVVIKNDGKNILTMEPQTVTVIWTRDQ
jgi:hypothetical protein